MQAELRGMGTTRALSTVLQAKAVWLSSLFLSYLRVAKMTQAWQGKARHEEGRREGGRGGGRGCYPESVALYYNLGRPGKARDKLF